MAFLITLLFLPLHFVQCPLKGFGGFCFFPFPVLLELGFDDHRLILKLFKGDIPLHDKNNIEQIKSYLNERSSLLDTFFNSL